MRTTAVIIDFTQERIKRRMMENEQHFRELAKRVVEAYKLHGDEGYHNAFFTACRGDREMADMLGKFVKEEIDKGMNR
jgi:hypothetical protein